MWRNTIKQQGTAMSGVRLGEQSIVDIKFVELKTKRLSPGEGYGKGNFEEYVDGEEEIYDDNEGEVYADDEEEIYDDNEGEVYADDGGEIYADDDEGVNLPYCEIYADAEGEIYGDDEGETDNLKTYFKY